MSHARALICACALVAVVANPAPPRRSENTEPKMQQEKSIVIKRIPNAYFYPFSLWPVPRFPARDKEDSYEEFYISRKLRNVEQNKR